MDQVELERIGESLFVTGEVEKSDLDAAEPAVEPTVVVNGVTQPHSGRWKVAPHVQLNGTYDDNIFIQPNDKVADFLFTAAAGVALGFWDYEGQMERFLDREHGVTFFEKGDGDFFLIDYTAIALVFAKTSSQNAFDQEASFDAQWQGERLTLGASGRFESKSEANIDVGTRVRRRTLNFDVTSKYALTEKTALEVDFFHTNNDPEDFVRSVEWRNEDFLEYHATPLLDLAIGGAVGRVQVESSPDQDFERALGRARYSVTEKIAAEIRGGVEFRQSNGETGDRVSPIIELRATYEPAAATRIELEAYRRVEPSAFRPDQDYTVTGFDLSASREVRAGLRLAVDGGYQNSDYTETRNESGRTDRFFFVRPRLLYNFARWGSAELSYEFRQNDSTRNGSSFDNNQISFRTSFVY